MRHKLLSMKPNMDVFKRNKVLGRMKHELTNCMKMFELNIGAEVLPSETRHHPLTNTNDTHQNLTNEYTRQSTVCPTIQHIGESLTSIHSDTGVEDVSIITTPQNR